MVPLDRTRPSATECGDRALGETRGPVTLERAEHGPRVANRQDQAMVTKGAPQLPRRKHAQVGTMIDELRSDRTGVKELEVECRGAGVEFPHALHLDRQPSQLISVCIPIGVRVPPLELAVVGGVEAASTKLQLGREAGEEKVVEPAKGRLLPHMPIFERKDAAFGMSVNQASDQSSSRPSHRGNQDVLCHGRSSECGLDAGILQYCNSTPRSFNAHTEDCHDPRVGTASARNRLCQESARQTGCMAQTSRQPAGKARKRHCSGLQRVFATRPAGHNRRLDAGALCRSDS